MPELVFFKRGEEVLRFSLDRERTTVGRGETCDIVIPDPTISRQQVAIIRESGSMYLEAGNPIERAPLTDGTDIALGQWTALYRENPGIAEDLPTREAGAGTDLQAAASVAVQSWPAIQLRLRHASKDELHRLTHEAITVGKDPSCDVQIADQFVSGYHCKIARKAGVFRVIDGHSTNGTYVGNVRIYEADVPLLTPIRLGETELILEPIVEGKRQTGTWGIIGKDPAIRQLLEVIDRVAPSTAAVAILGESGTGKELVARAVHARSSRKDKAFIPINCAAMSRELIESELFGHEKGAFTGAVAFRRGAFEEADGGTLFLDEIGELPLELQAKLLRALESGEIKRVGATRPVEVDTRIVAATNSDLLAACREGKFREDLYYRLCVIPLHLPPLRNRPGDILPIAEHFLRVFSPKGQNLRFTQPAMDKLQRHAWPGNVRELRNAIHRALLLRKGPTLDAADITLDAPGGASGPEVESSLDAKGRTLQEALEHVERRMVENALRRHDFNRERVAHELGVARSTLFKRLKRWGITQDNSEP